MNTQQTKGDLAATPGDPRGSPVASGREIVPHTSKLRLPQGAVAASWAAAVGGHPVPWASSRIPYIASPKTERVAADHGLPAPAWESH